jgi:hypothetical protein
MMKFLDIPKLHENRVADDILMGLFEGSDDSQFEDEMADKLFRAQLDSPGEQAQELLLVEATEFALEEPDSEKVPNCFAHALSEFDALPIEPAEYH